MPYLRLYSPQQEIPIARKEVIARKLIDITLRSFRLRAQDRNQITIQFVRPPGSNPCHMLEVWGHDLTQEKKQAFSVEAAAMLSYWERPHRLDLLGVLLRRRAKASHRLAFQFIELSPAVADPFVADAQRRAA